MNIASLINLGYTASDILGVLTKKGGQAGRKISHALSMGYSAVTVLNKLLGGKQSDEQFMTSEEKANENYSKQKRNAAVGAGLASLGVAGGLYGLASRAGTNALASQALPVAADQAKNVISPAQASIARRLPETAPSMPPTQSVQPPEGKKEFTTPFGDKLSKDFPQIENFIKKHAEAGKSEEETHKLFKQSKTLSILAKKFEDATGEDFSTVIHGIYEKNKKPSKDVSKKQLIDNVATLKSLMEGLKGK